MPGATKIWFGKELKKGTLVKRGSLKGLCAELGLSYSTAKKRQDTAGGVTMWLSGDSAYEVWLELVKR